VKSARDVNGAMPNSEYKSTRKVFLGGEQDKLIADFLVTAGDMYQTYGLSPKEARKLAYQCAKKNSK